MADNILVKDASGVSKTMRTTDTSGSDLHVPIHRLDGLTITGPAAQSVVNTDLLSGTVNGWVDVSAWASGAVQIIAGAGISAGAVIFEQTNDSSNTTGIPLEASELGVSNANPVTAAVTIAASTRRAFSFAVMCKFIRVRISTAFVGGTVQAIAQMSSVPFADPSLNVQQANGALLGTVNQDNAWYQESVTAQAANAAVTGTARTTGTATGATHGYSRFNAFALADQSGTMRVELSNDNTTWRRATVDTAVAANTPVTLTVPVIARWYRVVFTNGGVAQTVFHLNTSFTAS